MKSTINQTGVLFKALIFSFLYLAAFQLFAQDGGTLPGDISGIYPGAEEATTGGQLAGLIGWAVRILAYSLMVLAAVGAAWFIFTAFGRAADGRGNWGAFAGIAFGSLVMLTIVVTLGLVAVEWSAGLAAVV